MKEEVKDKSDPTGAGEEAAKVFQDASAAETIAEEEEDGDEVLRTSLGELEEKNRQLMEHLQRERAEFQNYKKRMASDAANLRQWAINGFVSDFIQVYDNLDLVLAQKKGNLEDFIGGVELIKKEFIGTLVKHNIKEFDPNGQKFDPNVMEAISLEEGDVQEEVVSLVFQKGFIAGEGESLRVIRPARVKVARPKAE